VALNHNNIYYSLQQQVKYILIDVQSILKLPSNTISSAVLNEECLTTINDKPEEMLKEVFIAIYGVQKREGNLSML